MPISPLEQRGRARRMEMTKVKSFRTFPSNGFMLGSVAKERNIV